MENIAARASGRRPPAGQRPRGFSLVEVTLALGIAAFCLLTLFGLLPTGINIVQKASEETIALNRASALLADVKATPATSSLSTRYGMDLTGASSAGTTLPEFLLDEQGNPVGKTSGAARYRVGYRISAPSSQPLGARVYLRVSWPGLASASSAQGMVEIAARVDRDE